VPCLFLQITRFLVVLLEANQLSHLRLRSVVISEGNLRLRLLFFPGTALK
jgi:hypothetical protein